MMGGEAKSTNSRVIPARGNEMRINCATENFRDMLTDEDEYLSGVDVQCHFCGKELKPRATATEGFSILENKIKTTCAICGDVCDEFAEDGECVHGECDDASGAGAPEIGDDAECIFCGSTVDCEDCKAIMSHIVAFQ